MWKPIGGGRSFIEDKSRAVTTLLERTAVYLLVLPKLQDFRLKIGKTGIAGNGLKHETFAVFEGKNTRKTLE